MTGIIVSIPPSPELPPGTTSGSTQVLPGITYQYAVLNLAQTWTAKQTFPLGNISIQAGDVIGLVASATTDTTNASNITSGTLPAARLPTPAPSTLGGIKSLTSVASKWVNSIGTDGTPTQTQPAFSNISGSPSVAQLAGSGAPLVILFTGQSYLTQTPALSWTPESNVLVWNWNGADGNVGTAYVAPSSTTINLANKFASDVARANPTRIVYLINIAFSGQAISHWLVGATAPNVFLNIQNNITAALSAAGATQIDLFGWVQGQGDCGPLNANYVANHATMMSRFWADTTTGRIWFPREIPALIFSIQSVADSNGLNADADNMNILLQAVASADPDKRRYVYLSSLTGATYFDSTAHPTAQGHFAMGAMAAAEFLRGTGRNNLPRTIVGPASGNITWGNTAYSSAPFVFNNNTSIAPSAYGTMQLVGADGAGTFVGVSAFGNFSGFAGQSANGTQAGPTALTTGNLITFYNANGYNGSTFANVAGIKFFASEVWSGTQRGTYASITNTLPGTNTEAESVRVAPGSVTINGVTSGGVTLAASPTASGTLSLPNATDTLVGRATTDALTNKTVNGATIDNLAWSTYTPTVGSQGGTFTTTSATGAYKIIGKTVNFVVQVNITTIGTATGFVTFSFPPSVTGNRNQNAAGKETTTGKMVTAGWGSGSTTGAVLFYDGTSPIAAGNILLVSGVIEQQ